MKLFVFSVAVALAAGQQFQQSQEFNPAVRLAGPGFFKQGGTFRSGSSFENRNRNSQEVQTRVSNTQFNTLSNNRDSASISRFQNENQFQSNRNSFPQNQQTFIISSNAQNQNRFQDQSIQQNQQNTFSTGAFQQGRGNQFQSTSSVSTSQINNGFRPQFSQENSRSQSQTLVGNQQDSGRNRLTAFNIQLTPSVRFQNQQVQNQQPQNQQITTTSFQADRNQQNAGIRFEQSGPNERRFENSNNQFNTNSPVSSFGSQSQSSNRQQLNSGASINQFTDEINGVFEPLNLPSGATRLLGSISSSFNCNNRPYGYYADQDNSCRVFHICNPALFSDGKIETYQYSFMCGEDTVFDQDAMTCKADYEATPCQEAANFYFRNEQFGRLEERAF